MIKVTVQAAMTIGECTETRTATAEIASEAYRHDINIIQQTFDALSEAVTFDAEQLREQFDKTETVQ